MHITKGLPMQEYLVTVDFNGIVLFDPQALEDFYKTIEIGENLYARFAKTDDGDKVVENGIIIPIIGINDSSYRVILRDNDEPSIINPELIIVSNEIFPFKITNQAVISDIATFLEWEPDEGWQKIAIAPGFYAAKINGFRLIEKDCVIDFGFEIVLKKCDELPNFTGSLLKNMQVLELPS